MITTTRITTGGLGTGPDGEPFVLECDHHANTNGLGKIQRAILGYLGTAPGGLDHTIYGHRGPYHGNARYAYCAARDWSQESQALWHHGPLGVRIPQVAAAVYGAKEPSASQIRVVQRNARRLEQLGLTDCWHGCAGYVERRYTQCNGRPGVMPQAVAALFVAFRWNCQHFAEQDKLATEYAEREKARWGSVTGEQALRILTGTAAPPEAS